MSGHLVDRLASLEKPIRLGIVGLGSVGKGLVYQSHITPGIQPVALADIRLERAIECAQMIGREYRIVKSVTALQDAVAQGFLAVCIEGELIAQCEPVEVFLDASNAIAAAGKFCIAALEHHKHLVMMNAEADLIFGPYLMRLAHANGVVYSSCDGDQPVIIKRLVDEIRLWGFELVMAGNVKGYLDRYSNPTTIVSEADKRGLDYRMATAYTDGTKLNIEMALVANALALRTDIPGMDGPRAQHVRDALTLFDLKNVRDSGSGVVNYVLGAEPKGGIFAIGYTENKFQQSMLAWFPPQMGNGPFYVFYRPYHLGHVEAMATVAAAALDGHSLLQPVAGFATNVYAYAKRDLHAGESLDGIGGYACYGLIENCDLGRNPGLPICLASEVVLQRNIARDEKIFWKDVAGDAGRTDFALYRRAAESTPQVNA